MRLFLFLSFFLMFNPVYSQDTSQSIFSRIEYLESAEKLRIEKFDLQVQELQIEASKILEEKKEDLDDKLDEIDRKITIYGPLLTGLTLLGILLFFWRGIVYVDKQMKTRIDALIQEKEEYFRQLVSSQEIEARIKDKIQLLVLSPNVGTEQQITKIIAQFKFPAKNVVYRVVENVDQLKGISTFQGVIIINDMEGGFDLPLLRELLEASSDDSLFLGFATGQQQLPRDPKMNYSNSKFTFYQNLINLAKFKDVVG